MNCATTIDLYDTNKFKEYLDNEQYTDHVIRRYEFIYGRSFVSPGGEVLNAELLLNLSLKPGQMVLDVGSGLGGNAIQMAKMYGVSVIGVDLSSNMIDRARNNLRKEHPIYWDRVHFDMDDVTTMEYPTGTFDVIYSRDVILHIADKESLFARFNKWLKPHGKLLITDYCQGESEVKCDEYWKYGAERGYNLITVSQYGRILTKVGFRQVQAKDITTKFTSTLHDELEKLHNQKDSFLRDFALSDFEYLKTAWELKVSFTTEQHQAWGLFLATKH